MMNEEIAKYCLRAMLDESPCEECDIYGQCGTDHCEDDAIRFVLKELEELKRYRNDGWIPVSSGKLPEEPKFDWQIYIVQSADIEQPYPAYWDGEFWTDVFDNEIGDVLAWQPLPQPYQPKGE